MKCETRDIDVMTCRMQTCVDVKSHLYFIYHWVVCFITLKTYMWAFVRITRTQTPQSVSKFNVTDAISCMKAVRSTIEYNNSSSGIPAINLAATSIEVDKTIRSHATLAHILMTDKLLEKSQGKQPEGVGCDYMVDRAGVGSAPDAKTDLHGWKTDLCIW